MNCVVWGLIFNIAGVLLIAIHSLYDMGMEMTLKILEAIKREKNEANFTIWDKLKNRESLSPVEWERFATLVKREFALRSVCYVVTIWLWINQKVFRFTPWMEDAPRLINRYFWNVAALFLILVGFVFQLIGSVN